MKPGAGVLHVQQSSLLELTAQTGLHTQDNQTGNKKDNNSNITGKNNNNKRDRDTIDKSNITPKTPYKGHGIWKQKQNLRIDFKSTNVITEVHRKWKDLMQTLQNIDQGMIIHHA